MGRKTPIALLLVGALGGGVTGAPFVCPSGQNAPPSAVALLIDASNATTYGVNRLAALQFLQSVADQGPDVM